MSFDKFTNDFCQWFNKFDNTRKKIKLLTNCLKKIAEVELPLRNDERLFKVRNFINTKDFELNFIYKNLWCKSDSEKGLLVGTLCPNWNSGWKEVCKDEFVSDQIDYFFHFATQYIYRSYQINLIGSLAFTYNRYFDFRGDFLSWSILPYSINSFQEYENGIKTMTCNKTKRIKHYLNIINALDPYVNKAIYYYVKAIDLYDKSYSEETVTNLDNTIDVVTQFVKERFNLPTMRRKDLLGIVDTHFELGEQTIENLEKLYLLRCQFFSHPALSKWWDFGELYDDDIEKLLYSVKFTLIKMFQYETNNRIISQNPKNWSDWFMNYADKVFSVTWFNNLV